MAKWDEIVAVVPGGANTDLVISPTRLVGPGELSVGGRLTVGPGGKSRNVAQMMAAYLGRGRVAFVGRTLARPQSYAALDAMLSAGSGARVDDVLPYAYALLAEVPLVALERAGVVTDFVRRVPCDGTAGGVAEILVSEEGENTIYLASGVNAEFSGADVEAARPLLEAVGARGGVMPLALEIPASTAARAAELARQAGLRVVVDPGGITDVDQYGAVLRGADVLKPNEHEARMLSGIEVGDEASARAAGRAMMERWDVGEVVITAGSRGVWQVSAAGEVRTWEAHRTGPAVDTTGCGDQFMAILCAGLAEERSLDEAVMRRALVAAGLQARRAGIQPVTREEIERE